MSADTNYVIISIDNLNYSGMTLGPTKTDNNNRMITMTELHDLMSSGLKIR
jgi:hypothetical protein